MNSQVSKRIRHAARIISKPGSDYRANIKRLKREYRETPYHMRNTPVKESHGALLKRIHSYPVVEGVPV